MASLTKKYSKEKLTGQIFTPNFIVEKILDDVNFKSNKILGKRILDPACGDGRFLTKIAERIIKYSSKKDLERNLSFLFGWDTDKDAIIAAKKELNNLIKHLGISVKWNLNIINSLHKGLKYQYLNDDKKFDFIVGNPPYIRIQHLDITERKFIQQNYIFCKSGSTDIYIAFYELAQKLLKENGKCAYITPNTFFHTDTAKYLRNYFETQKNLIQITNYSHIQLFRDATTYSAIVIFSKKNKTNFLFQLANDTKKFSQRTIGFSELQNKQFWQLSTKKIKNKKSGKRLGDISNIHVGITTLADKIYILKFIRQDGSYLILNSKDKKEIKIEKDILKPIIKVSTLKNANEQINKYIIFPYKKINNKHKIIPENELRTKYPFTYKYLKSVKPILDKRDNGKPNPIAWYAFGRTQSLDTSFGEKILFSPMNKKPNFIYHKNKEASFYSGYCIKYKGNINDLLKQLNSDRMEEFIRVSSRDFRGGWKAYNKKIVQEFIIYDK